MGIEVHGGGPEIIAPKRKFVPNKRYRTRKYSSDEETQETRETDQSMENVEEDELDE